MARRYVPDKGLAKYERFRLLKVQRYASDQSLALSHGNSRNTHIVTVLAYMAVLRDPARLSKPMPANPDVTCTAAIRRLFAARGGQQAAHLLPGQIRINNQLPWSFLKEPHVARALENEFAFMTPLDANFNKADSACESKGLTEAFALACGHVLKGKGVPTADIVKAYRDVFVPTAREAYDDAEAQKRTKPSVPPIVHGNAGGAEYGMIMNLEERGAAMADDSIWDVHEQLRIIDYYRASLERIPANLEPARLASILGPL